VPKIDKVVLDAMGLIQNNFANKEIALIVSGGALLKINFNERLKHMFFELS
jgi:hypothetical protein